jgi:hypothetical protein
MRFFLSFFLFSFISLNNTPGPPDAWVKLFWIWIRIRGYIRLLKSPTLFYQFFYRHGVGKITRWLFLLLDCCLNGFSKSRKNGVLARYAKKNPALRGIAQSSNAALYSIGQSFKKFYLRLRAMPLSVKSKSDSALCGTAGCRLCAVQHCASCAESHIYANISANSQPYAKII